MSSIFGKINFHQKPITLEELSIMENRLNHWNADDKGVWKKDNIGLGHLMLRNTPESLQERLPFYDSDIPLVITADARIDNREELFAKLYLDKKNVIIPDSTLIVMAYKKYGKSCVQHLIGDFAFAIWDEKEQHLFCARDQMGVKPFFYYQDDCFFAFASEKKGILTLPDIDTTIDKQFFYNQIIWPPHQNVDTTLYKKIKRLPPASTLILSILDRKIVLNRYWTLDAVSETKLASEKDYYEGLLFHFDEAIKCRLRSYYTVGAELSGGLDSSAIIGAACKFLKQDNKQIITFSNTLPEGITDENLLKLDERKYIDAVIAFNNIEHFNYITENLFNDPWEEIDFSLEVNEGFEMWNPLWQIPIKNAATQKGVRTLLSGFPGDEMVTFKGSHYYLDFLDRKNYLKYFSAKATKYDKGFNKVTPFIPFHIGYGLHKLKNIVVQNDRATKTATQIFKIPFKYRLNRGDVIWKDPFFRERFKSYRHFLKQRLLKPQVSLRMESETRYGLYFKIEPRFPMADIRLAQFYLSMPNKLKYSNKLSRYTYRKAVKEYLPQLIFDRNDKYGSVIPFQHLPGYYNKQKEVFLSTFKTLKEDPLSAAYISKNTLTNKRPPIVYLDILKWLKNVRY